MAAGTTNSVVVVAGSVDGAGRDPGRPRPRVRRRDRSLPIAPWCPIA